MQPNFATSVTTDLNLGLEVMNTPTVSLHPANNGNIKQTFQSLLSLQIKSSIPLLFLLATFQVCAVRVFIFTLSIYYI